jgi:hypothetical protein
MGVLVVVVVADEIIMEMRLLRLPTTMATAGSAAGGTSPSPGMRLCEETSDRAREAVAFDGMLQPFFHLP